jgi:hypothetical protein
VFVLFCVGSGLATGLIPRPSGPTDCSKIRSIRLVMNGNRPEDLLRQWKKNLSRSCNFVNSVL